MKTIWKGHIRFSLVTIPIQVFTAANSKGNISFNQLHRDDGGRIKYQKVCQSCGDIVPFKDLAKGYEYKEDHYVVLTKSDFKQLKLKSTKAIDIESFVNEKEVHPSKYEAVYYLGPDGDIAHEPYILLRDAMRAKKKAAIGRIVLRDKEDVIMIAPYNEGLIMYKLRYPYELRKIEDVPGIVKGKAESSKLEMANMLIDTMTTDFEKVDFSDRYKIALEALIDEKLKGKEQLIATHSEEESSTTIDIMDALRKSIEAKKK